MELDTGPRVDHDGGRELFTSADFVLAATIDLPHAAAQIWGALTDDRLGAWMPIVDRARWIDPPPRSRGARRTVRLLRPVTIDEEFHIWDETAGSRSARWTSAPRVARAWGERAELDALPDGGTRLTSLRPLDAALGAQPGTDEPSPAESPTLWDLARTATALRAEPIGPPEIVEATAALQDLACGFAATDGSPELEDMLAQLHEIQAGLPAAIQSEPNGPYLVTNAESMVDWLGRPLPTRPQMALCRCGASKIKPFCDGSHGRDRLHRRQGPQARA